MISLYNSGADPGGDPGVGSPPNFQTFEKILERFRIKQCKHSYFNGIISIYAFLACASSHHRFVMNFSSAFSTIPFENAAYRPNRYRYIKCAAILCNVTKDVYSFRYFSSQENGSLLPCESVQLLFKPGNSQMEKIKRI